MDLKDYQVIFKALENERRIEIYEFILQRYFVSKSDLAIEFNLNRASLNHHLEILVKTGLICELALMLDARRQFFLVPVVRIQPDKLIKQDQEFHILKNTVQSWTNRNITLESWRTLRSELNDVNLSSEILESVETRLFPNIGRRTSKVIEYCYICRITAVFSSCSTCKNLLCKTHSHKIEREKGEFTILCPNCIEKFFG